METSNPLPALDKKPLHSLLKSCLHLGVIVLLFVVPGVLIKKGLLPTHCWGAFFINGSWTEAGDQQNRFLVYLLFILVSGLLIGIGFPRLWVSSLSGGIFGVTAGIFLSLAASVLGAAIVFHAGRMLMSKRLNASLYGSLSGLKKKFEKHTFIAVLHARLFPFSNSTIVSLFSGACKVNFSQFIGASLLGFLPLTTVFCLVGNGSLKMQSRPILLGFGLMVLLYIGTWIFRKRTAKDLPEYVSLTKIPR